MIIADGHIEVLQTTGAAVSSGCDLVTIAGLPITTGGNIDDDGYPIEHPSSYGSPIECQVVPVKVDRLAKDSTERVKAESYDIYVAMSDIDGDIRILRLTWLGYELGNFSVNSIEPLPAVQQLKISVSHAD